jgi:hypothetical protein
MRIVNWVSGSRSLLTKIPRTSDTPFLMGSQFTLVQKAKEFKRKFNGFSKTQKLGVGRGGFLHYLLKIGRDLTYTKIQFKFEIPHTLKEKVQEPFLFLHLVIYLCLCS